ncbi:hypothetical protein AKJ37_01445 [candidate division MSBL1 archaeon SCGC-AAA259I09]|uniref:ArnR1-like winged helix-turn-helix domain-containing protein n=2 Tax=candidate division MSBL1 TaxID=215777 RepID=A0A133UTN3_9EURY|nr:hypothetical protein AKJ38_01150 [candidate division MSBL1 archaeon SCGC-AAA259I14]KXA98053.1 hypothetical protein AKJ37_01445 [candidate division MSBL1 archaeon SCGC-AAA259I09]
MNEDRWGILSDIIEPLYENESCKFSKLKQEMNLSPKKLKQYISFLLDRQYLQLENENGKKNISITNKGKVFFRVVDLRKKPEKESFKHT